MMRILFGIFLILHGLVHLWYVVLSFGLVKYQNDMGWTGMSWVIPPSLAGTPAKTIAGFLFIGATLLFVLSGIATFADMNAVKALLLISAIFSTVILVLFWDGQSNMIVQKGIIGVILNVIIAIIALRFL